MFGGADGGRENRNLRKNIQDHDWKFVFKQLPCGEYKEHRNIGMLDEVRGKVNPLLSQIIDHHNVGRKLLQL